MNHEQVFQVGECQSRGGKQQKSPRRSLFRAFGHPKIASAFFFGVGVFRRRVLLPFYPGGVTGKGSTHGHYVRKPPLIFNNCIRHPSPLGHPGSCTKPAPSAAWGPRFGYTVSGDRFMCLRGWWSKLAFKKTNLGRRVAPWHSVSNGSNCHGTSAVT